MPLPPNMPKQTVVSKNKLQARSSTSLLPYSGSAGSAVWARPRLSRGSNRAQPGPREAAAEDRGPQSSAPFPLSPEVTGRAAKAVSAGRWQLLSVTAALLAAAPAVHGGQCVLLGWDPLNQGSPQAAAACCFLPSFSSLPLRRNGIWREGGKEEREGKGRREG